VNGKSNKPSENIHRKKSFSIFPSPAGMSLTKLSLGGNNLYMTSLFPPRESLVSDIPAGDGNIKKLFTVYYTVCFKPPKKLPLFDKVSPKVFAICEEGKQV
jgi:hypothetical protein